MLLANEVYLHEETLMKKAEKIVIKRVETREVVCSLVNNCRQSVPPGSKELHVGNKRVFLFFCHTSY